MSFFDLTDTLASSKRFDTARNKTGFVIQFYHIATFKKGIQNQKDNGAQATFKAFLTSFKDNFKVNWNAKETFGRMDAVQTFKNTQRQITVSFDVPSHSEEEAQINFIELQKLIMMQYPVYETMAISSAPPPDTSKTTTSGTGDRDNEINKNSNADNEVLQNKKGGPTQGRFISSPPLLYIKFMNWISENPDQSSRDKISNADDALVGIIDQVSFNPDLDQGVHFIDNKLVPKLFTVDLNITVIHTKELGWVNTARGSTEKLKNHVFGDPEFLSDVGVESYSAYPYQVENFNFSEDE